ncbi:MAG: hypothetical protein JO142_02190 [Burkholderiales bacterium]|nr:hypothetical protein [Burkholderiales bacterium]
MPIQNFPAQLQPIIQQGFLETEFQKPLLSQLVYRSIADREVFPNKIGETITKTRNGLKNPVTTPSNPANNTNLDNGMSPSQWTVEQFTLSINQYSDTIDLNIVNEKVGMASQFLKNAKVNGFQAAQSLDRLARNTLFGVAGTGTVGGYMGGNTRVRVSNGSAATTVSVDDVRGFQVALVSGQNFITAGQPQAASGTFLPVSPSATATVIINGNPYTLIGATVDASNQSTTPNGVSGVLTFQSNVLQADAQVNNTVQHYNAPTMLRPNGRANTSLLQSTDLLTLGLLLDAQAQLRNNAPMEADEIDVYLDNKSMRQLFADQDFKILFQGQYGSDEFRTGRVYNILGLRLHPTTEAFVQYNGQAAVAGGPTWTGPTVRRVICCIKGALVEGDFEGIGTQFDNESHIIHVAEGVAQIVRPPLDRLGQIIAQSWYWIGGFTLPTDATANQIIIPTASNAYLKRGVVIEHC